MLSPRFAFRSKDIGQLRPSAHRTKPQNGLCSLSMCCWLVPRIGAFFISDGLHGRCLPRKEGWARDKILADCAEDGSEAAIIAAARLSALNREAV